MCLWTSINGRNETKIGSFVHFRQNLQLEVFLCAEQKLPDPSTFPIGSGRKIYLIPHDDR